SPGRSTSVLSCCSVHNERNEGLPGRCADSWQKGGRYRPATLPAMEPQTVLCALSVLSWKKRSGLIRHIGIRLSLVLRDVVAERAVRDEVGCRIARLLERVQVAGHVVALPAAQVAHTASLEPQLDA